MADGNQDLSRARICIDFGTALSKASVCLDPTMPLSVGVKPLAIGAASRAEHSLLTPSVIFVDGGRIFFFGQKIRQTHALGVKTLHTS